MDEGAEEDDNGGGELPAETVLQLEAKKELILGLLRARLNKMLEDNDLEIHVAQGSNQWHQGRFWRLTASLFFEVCRRKPETLCQALVCRILYD